MIFVAKTNPEDKIMNNTTVSFVCNIFDYIIYFILIKNLINNERKKANHSILRSLLPFTCFLFCQIVCFYFTDIYKNTLYIFLIEFFTIILLLYLHFRPIFTEYLVSISLAYFFLFITQIIFALIISLTGFSLTTNTTSIVACFVTLILALIITYIFNTKKITAIFCNTHKLGAIALISTFSIAIALSFYFKIDTKSFTNSAIIIFVFVVIILMIISISANQLITISNMTKNLDAYNQYMPMLDELILNVRKRQHNHTNEIQAIIGLMHTHRDYDSLKNAMSVSLKHFDNDKEPEYLLKLNLLLVSGFLYQKQCYAKKIGRDINFNFKTYDLHTKVPEYELIEMFGILIDNSLEASNLGETITIMVNSYDDKIEFTTKNSGHILSDEEYQNFFIAGYSNKPESAPNKKYSGLGLFTLRELVMNKYNGTISLWNEDNDILFRIVV